jgi:hypothetical protein
MTSLVVPLLLSQHRCALSSLCITATRATSSQVLMGWGFKKTEMVYPNTGIHSVQAAGTGVSRMPAWQHSQHWQPPHSAAHTSSARDGGRVTGSRQSSSRGTLTQTVLFANLTCRCGIYPRAMPLRTLCHALVQRHHCYSSPLAVDSHTADLTGAVQPT